MTDDQNAVDLSGYERRTRRTYTTDLSVLKAQDSSGNTLNLTGQLTATDIDSDAAYDVLSR